MSPSSLTLVEHATEAIALLDGHGQFLYVSPAAARINGYPLETFAGQDAFSIIHPDDLPTVMAAFGKLLNDPDVPLRAECRLQHADGAWLWVDVIACNRLADPAVGAVVVNFRDVTAQHHLLDELEARVATRTAELEVTNTALRESEEQFRLVTSACPAAIFVWQHGRYVYANDAAAAMTGYPCEQLLAMSLEALVPEEYVEMMRGYARARLAGQPAPEHYEVEYLTRDGARRWADFTPRVVLYRGAPAIISSVSDITERKAADAALMQSEERYRRLFDDSPIPMMEVNFGQVNRALDTLTASGIADLKTYLARASDILANLANLVTICAANDAAMHLLQADMPEDVTVGSLLRFMTPDNQTVFLEGIFAFETGATSFEQEITHRTLRGESRTLLLRVFQLPGSTRDDERVLLTAIDITERKQAEDAMQRLLTGVEQRAAELDTTIGAIADAVLIYSPQGELLRINDAGRAMTRYSTEDIAQSIDDRTAALRMRAADGTPLAPAETPAMRALRGETIRNMILSFTCRDGQTIWTSVSAAPIRASDGAVLGAVATIADITAQHRQQECQEEFLHMVSHDLRIPLTVIQGHAQVLEHGLNDVLDHDRARVCTRAIQHSARRMNVMIQDLVDLARIEGHQLVLQRDALALQRYLPELYQRLTGTLALGRVTLEASETLPVVSVDADRLERILVNLLSNALKYSPPDAPVLLRATAGDGGVTIAVIDQGMGIPPEAIPHLFDRFYRVNAPRKAEGLGLGLYITRLLVEAHGGTLDVESTPGQGSTFRIFLPVGS